jgi:hypothetical protein
MQNLHQPTWNRAVLYCDISSKDEQLWTRRCLWKTKNTNMEGGSKQNVTVCFTETTHKPLHLAKLSSIQQNIMDIPTSFIWITFFYEAFSRGDGVKNWSYVRTNPKALWRILCFCAVSYLCKPCELLLHNVYNVGGLVVSTTSFSGTIRLILSASSTRRISCSRFLRTVNFIPKNHPIFCSGPPSMQHRRTTVG